MHDHMVLLCYILLKVVREVNFHQGSLSAVSISKSDSTLFVGTQNGVVIAVLLPMIGGVVQNEFKMHNKSITKVAYFL